MLVEPKAEETKLQIPEVGMQAPRKGRHCAVPSSEEKLEQFCDPVFPLHLDWLLVHILEIICIVQNVEEDTCDA